MDAQAVRRRALSALVALAGAACAGLAAAASDRTYLTAEELARQMLGNVVTIGTRDQAEHGFGLVVGADRTHVFVATARHVVGEAPSERIEVAFCAADRSGAGPVAAARVQGFEGGGRDVALLRVPRPAGYSPALGLLAEDGDLAKGQDAWLLGQAGQCGMAARSGAVAALRNARDDLRIDFPGALGGSSGGPVVTGYGIAGLVTAADDLTFTAFDISALAALVQAQVPGAWQLQAARNIPPTDPRAAQMDLAETLNLYLFGAYNVQGLLLQPTVPQKLFFDFSADYNNAINRFGLVRNRYDGALQRLWPPAVLPMWQALRDELWQVHQAFWKLNDGAAKVIFETQRVPPDVQAEMKALAPALKNLKADVDAFLTTIATRNPP